ncbi:hypothetical protein ACD578_15890 [Microvirga sp. RSM25]|uniref:hypothetical protein n=1 Tax=Microvirga sp. RSM25 TaxID=3273802 RepID=UPI00384D0B22
MKAEDYLKGIEDDIRALVKPEFIELLQECDRELDRLQAALDAKRAEHEQLVKQMLDIVVDARRKK